MSEIHTEVALPPGTRIQEYRIRDVLGMGSFGIVYVADNVYLDETVAIKEFLPTDLACRREGTRVIPISSETADAYKWALEHFLKEARILWGLASPSPHPNIVRVMRFHEENGTAYMVMEFERGKPLSDVLEKEGPLPEDRLRGILMPLLDGLERVHGASIWHRDIKPGNILIREDGSPVLIDFGAARQELGDGARSVMAVFSPTYAAPEQVIPTGRQGPWTDIYALGATLYRAVTGHPPPNATERLQGDSLQPASQAAARSYQPDFLKAIDAALALRTDQRPQNIAQWRPLFEGEQPGTVLREPSLLTGEPELSSMDVDEILPHLKPGEEEPGAAPEPAPESVAAPRRPRWGLIGAGLGGIAAVIAAVWFAWPGREPEPPTVARAPTPEVEIPQPVPAEPPTTPIVQVPKEPEPIPKPEPAIAPEPEREPSPPAPTTRPTEPSVTPAPEPVPTPEVVPEPPAPAPTPSEAEPEPEAIPEVAPAPLPAPVDADRVLAEARGRLTDLSCARLAVQFEPEAGRLSTTGFVSSATDLRELPRRLSGIEGVRSTRTGQVELQPPPFCEMLLLLGDYLAEPASAGLQLSLNRSGGFYREGEFLVLEVAAPPRDGYLYVDYLDAEGNIVHMLPAPGLEDNAVTAAQRLTIGDGGIEGGQRSYEVVPPHGRNMVFLIYSDRPLFRAIRPEVETLESYGEALRASLTWLAQEDGVTILAARRAVVTEP